MIYRYSILLAEFITMRQLVLLSSVILLFLMGCTSKHTVFDVIQPSSEKGSIVYVYRPSAMANAMISPALLFNGELVTTLEDNSYLYRHVTPGLHVLNLDLGERYTGIKKIVLNVRPNEVYFIRMTSELRFEMNKPYTRTFNLESVDSSTALNELASMSVKDKSKSSIKGGEVEVGVSSENIEDAQFSIENTRNPFSK